MACGTGNSLQLVFTLCCLHLRKLGLQGWQAHQRNPENAIDSPCVPMNAQCEESR